MTLECDCFQARLWMQVMRQLRHGVKLKKMEQPESEQPREFELTPYEMLMEDIASRRYNLSKVTVSSGSTTLVSHYHQINSVAVVTGRSVIFHSQYCLSGQACVQFYKTESQK